MRKHNTKAMTFSFLHTSAKRNMSMEINICGLNESPYMPFKEDHLQIRPLPPLRLPFYLCLSPSH